MIDHLILPIQHRVLNPLAKRIAKTEVTANEVTIAGFGVGVLAFLAICFEAYILGLVLILVNRLADGLDGIIAREKGTTELGAYLDIVLDFIFYASIPLAFAIAEPRANALSAAFLLFTFIGTASAFLSFSIFAAKDQSLSTKYPRKGIYYLGGLTEGFETIFAFVLMCLFPTYFAIIACIFALACVVTTSTRIHYAYLQLGEK